MPDRTKEADNTAKMPDTTTKAEQDLAILKSTVATLTTLIAHLQTPNPLPDPAPASISASIPTLEPSSSSPTADSTPPTTAATTPPIDALALAHSTSSLIKAHTTKLSLLLLTPPFTPTALTRILVALTNTLPPLSSSTALCLPATHTTLLARDLAHYTSQLLTSLTALLATIPDEYKDADRERVLAATAPVWEACEKIMALKDLGVPGLCVRKAQEYRALLMDALEELREWSEEEEEEEASDADDATSHSDEEDDIFTSKPPSSQIRPLLEPTLKRLRSIAHFYTAVVKHRLRAIPSNPTPACVARVNEVLDVLREIPEGVDELAGAFYEGDERGVGERMAEVVGLGVKGAGVVERDWEEGEDGFTGWVGKWKGVILEEGKEKGK